MPNAPGSLETLRQHNRTRVVQLVHHRGAISRADVARATGLSRSTVSSLVGDLLRDGLVVEQSELSPTGGRPAYLLTLNPLGTSLAGVHLAHDSVRVVIADITGEPLVEDAYTFDVVDDLDAAVQRATSTISSLVSDIGASTVAAVGVAVSAPVTTAGHGPATLAERSGYDRVGAKVTALVGAPVRVFNDANAGAVAEWVRGAGRGADDMVYVMLSDGVGAGLVVDGRLREGARGVAGEIGHVVVDPGGRPCRCGNRGCLETVAGGRALVAALFGDGATSTIEEVTARCRRGDARAVELVTAAGRAVGRAVASLVMTLDPDVVVVGGKLLDAGDALMGSVRAELGRQGIADARRTDDHVQTGDLGTRAEALGSLILAGHGVAVVGGAADRSG